jgi:hypothetical protein
MMMQGYSLALCWFGAEKMGGECYCVIYENPSCWGHFTVMAVFSKVESESIFLSIRGICKLFLFVLILSPCFLLVCIRRKSDPKGSSFVFLMKLPITRYHSTRA